MAPGGLSACAGMQLPGIGHLLSFDGQQRFGARLQGDVHAVLPGGHAAEKSESVFRLANRSLVAVAKRFRVIFGC